MYSIKDELTYEYIINKSKFIVKAYYLDDINNIENIIKKVKKEYKDANHYCYAYIIDNKTKSNDDKEPSGTAGIPILNVLLKNKLNNILCVVIRYFGGIKLGSGGLIRAYTNAVSYCLEKNIIEYVSGYKIRITFDYTQISNIDYLLKNYEIIYKEYNDNIIYDFIIEQKEYDEIKNLFKNSKIISKLNIIKKRKP